MSFEATLVSAHCEQSMIIWVQALLKYLREGQKSVALIDATDLPAATADKKKTAASGQPNGRP